MLWLLGDEDCPDDSSAPFAEQLCQVTYEQGDVAVIDWTQSSDGLMVADACGHVSMYGTLAGGIGFSAACPEQTASLAGVSSCYACSTYYWAAVSNALHKKGGLVQVLMSWA